MNIRITDLLDCYYDDTVELLPPEQLNTSAPPAPIRRKRPTLFRCAIAAAIIGSLLIGASITALAANYGLWNAIAQWTSEIFHFSAHSDETNHNAVPPAQINPELEPLQNALIAGGISAPQIPRYLPEGYRQEELTASEQNNFWGAAYVRDGDYIMISITDVQGQLGAHYEKDDMTPEVYSHGGTDHYIMTNMGSYTAVWTNGQLEYAIFGAEEDELYKMLDSIYETPE